MAHSNALLEDEDFGAVETPERRGTPSGPGIRQARRTLALPGESSRDLSAVAKDLEPPEVTEVAHVGHAAVAETTAFPSLPAHPSGTYLIGSHAKPAGQVQTPPRVAQPSPELNLGPRTAETPLETARLRIVPVDAADAYEFFEAVQKGRRTLRKVLPWVEYVRGPLDALAYLRSSERDWEEQRAYRFTIRDASSGEFLGIVGFENVVLFHAAMDVGYWLRSDRTGEGRMSEALHAVLTRARWSWRVHRFRAFAAKENVASHAILEKFGFQRQGEIPEAEWCNGRWLDHVAYGALSRDMSL